MYSGYIHMYTHTHTRASACAPPWRADMWRVEGGATWGRVRESNRLYVLVMYTMGMYVCLYVCGYACEYV